MGGGKGVRGAGGGVGGVGGGWGGGVEDYRRTALEGFVFLVRAAKP